MIVESYEDVIVLSGALKSNFWETIHTAISLLLKRHPTGVIIDCEAITECTIAGADTFIDVMNFIEDHDARILVARVPDHVLEVLKKVPEVRSQLPIAKSVEEARRSLDLLAQHHDDRKRKPVSESDTKVVLYLTGDPSDAAGSFAAIRMAEIMRASVILAYVIIVPRELPEQAPLPEKEEAALRAFDSVKGIFSQDGVSTTPMVRRGRDIGAVLDDLMEEEDAHTLVVALSNDLTELDSELKITKAVLQKVEQSVMFVRPPLPKA